MNKTTRPIFLVYSKQYYSSVWSTGGSVGVIVPVLVSPPFFGLMGVLLGSVISFSLPFRLIGLREGVLANEGKVAWQEGLTEIMKLLNIVRKYYVYMRIIIIKIY